MLFRCRCRSAGRNTAGIRKSESAYADTGNIGRADPGNPAVVGSGGYGEEKGGSVFTGNEAAGMNVMAGKEERCFRKPFFYW